MLHRNLPLKAASLAVAVFLWFWVLFTQRTVIVETTTRGPIAARELAPDLALESELPVAEVKLRGRKDDLGERAPRVEAFVSCRGLRAGHYLLPVEVAAPPAVTVVEVRPARVEVAIEPVVKESRLVETTLTGSLSPEYELLGAEVSPKYARVSGPRSRVSQVARLVAAVDLSEVAPELPAAAAVEAVDARGNLVAGVTVTPARVAISLSVRQVAISRAVPVVLRSRGNPPRGYRVVSARVEPAIVTISGPANKVLPVREVETEEVSLEGVTARMARRVPLVVPEGTRVLGGHSVVVEVVVEPEEGG